MVVFPRGTKLYRITRWLVILASFSLVVAQILAQSAARKSAPKGPRALGLVQLAPSGKAHLIPITILYDGEFYDASAYKASPVPMALESGTVYEGVRAGVSQGLFTVSSALQGNNTWIGDGTWQSASTIAAAKAAAAKKKEATAKPAPEPAEGPPVLRRANAKPGPAPPTPPPASSPEPPPPASSAATTSAPPSTEEDPDRPVLKRGMPPPAETKKSSTTAAAPTKVDTRKPSSPAASMESSALQLIPAISDANGPDPRPYAQDVKPDELEKLRKKVLVLAADEVRARATQLVAESVGSPTPHASSRAESRAKLPQPSFDDVQLHVFDLSNSNEPTLVLTADAHMPDRPSGATGQDLKYIVTLVARDDIYGELHKAFSNVTDSQHLDVIPRLELIDAVDADGDGRGELLFREISDAGKAFVVYRVIGDRLWPLFHGTPGL